MRTIFRNKFYLFLPMLLMMRSPDAANFERTISIIGNIYVGNVRSGEIDEKLPYDTISIPMRGSSRS